MKNISIFVILTALLFLSPLSVYSAKTNSALESLYQTQYFELRDTIELLNHELALVIQSPDKSNFFDKKDPVTSINGCIIFIDKRIKEFEQAYEKINYFYVKKLKEYFQITLNLQLQAKKAIKLSRLDKGKISVKQAEEEGRQDKAIKIYETKREAYLRPYFEPIDVRVLAAVPKGGTEYFTEETEESQDSLYEEAPDEIMDAMFEEAPEITDNKNFSISPEINKKDKVNLKENIPNKKVIGADRKSRNKKKALKKSESKSAKARQVFNKIKERVPSQRRDPSKLRPIAVMVENHKKARPQTGLNKADVIYEIPVEGGITRFMAVYTKLPNIIGPIRSCREYFVTRSMESDALYVHCGGSPKGYEFLSANNIKNIDEIYHNKPFYRDKSRKAPHNLYTHGKDLLSYAEQAYNMYPKHIKAPIERVDEVSKTAGPKNKANSLSIKYSSNYKVDIKYENGFYYRYMNGELHVDRKSGDALKAVAVIIQTVPMKTVDKEGRLAIDFTGSGKALLMTDGEISPITWSKASNKAPTEYKHTDGTKCALPGSGQIWILTAAPYHIIEKGTKP